MNYKKIPSNIPIKKTKKNQKRHANQIRDLLFSHPLGEAKITGSVRTNIKEKIIRAKTKA